MLLRGTELRCYRSDCARHRHPGDVGTRPTNLPRDWNLPSDAQRSDLGAAFNQVGDTDQRILP